MIICQMGDDFKKNKEETKRRLIKSVGFVMNMQGFAALTVSRIARQAQVDRKLIKRYFGGLDGLIEAYIIENDYWMLFSEKLKDLLEERKGESPQQLLKCILTEQFNSFYNDRDMQNLILWELTAKSDLMRSIHNARELIGQQLLELTDPYLKNSGVDFRAVAALLVGGIYYTILHIRNNGEMFSDVNLASEQGQLQITNAINQIVDWAFESKSKTHK